MYIGRTRAVRTVIPLAEEVRADEPEQPRRKIHCNWCGYRHFQPAQSALEALKGCLAREETEVEELA